MSKNSILRTIYIFIFFIIFLVSFLSVRPVYDSISKNISERTDYFKNIIEEKTGLTFSYSSLSPSILAVFNIKGIVLKSASDGKELVSIRKIILKYKLHKLIRGDFENAFKSLVIDGVTVEFDETTDNEIIKKISSLFVSDNSNKTNFSFANLSVESPISILIKNIHLIYNGKNASADVVIKSLHANYNEISNAINILATGDADANIKFKDGLAISGKYSIEGSIYPNLNDSSLIVRFLNLSSNDFSFGRLNLLLSYNSDVISIRTIQSSFPLMLLASYNIKSNIADVAFSAEQFTISSFMTAKKSSPLLKKIGRISLTATASAQYNFSEKLLSYKSNGKVFVPDNIIPGSVNARYSLSGNEKSISLSNVSMTGENYEADASLYYEFDNIRLSGSINAPRIVMPNGGIVSTEIYFDPLSKGFVGFAPAVILGEQFFTAMQIKVIPNNNSVDFSFEVSDYSHAETEDPGQLKIDGSYLSATNYFQAGLSVTNFYLDSAAKASAFFVEKNIGKTISSVAPSLSPYVFTGEMYVSSDLKSISYNAPYTLFANTKKENQILFLSFDGNESSLQISELNLLYNKSSFTASAEIDSAPDSSSSFFTLDMTHGEVPYHFTGNIFPNYITVSGDYNFMAQLNRFEDGSLEGFLTGENFPVNVGATIFAVSTETGFAYTLDEGFALHISRFEAEDAGEKYSFAPHLLFSGTVTKYGAFFDSISYSDKFSAMAGSAQCIVNFNESIFDSAHLTLNLSDTISPESLNISTEITNPDNLPFSLEALKEQIYFNCQISFNNVNLNRFVAEQSDNNTLTASVATIGTLANPYIAFSIENSSVMFAGSELAANFSATLEEKNITVNYMNVSYGKLNLSDVQANFSLASFTGKATAQINGEFSSSNMSLPITFEMSDTEFSDTSSLPSSFVFTVSSSGTEGNFITAQMPFSLTLLRSQGYNAIFSSENLGISGHFTDDGTVDIIVGENKPFHCAINGNVTRKMLDINVSDVSVDLAKLMSLIPNDIITIYSGTLTGSTKISGLLTDPEFTGMFSVSKPDFSLPMVIPYHITRDRFSVILDYNNISIPMVTTYVKNREIDVSVDLYLDRWFFDRLEIAVKTPEGKTAPADLNIFVAQFTGMASVDLNLLLQDNIFEILGKVYVEDVKSKIRMQEIIAEKDMAGPVFIRTDIDIILGSHVNVVLDPILRGVFVPGDRVNFKMDQSDNTFAIIGNLNLRSGDIAYLNRSFYLKEGSIKFNDTDELFNPRITVRAETRERDESGNDVRIILSAENQSLIDFNPQFSTVPAKSEIEIQALLGQIVTQDRGGMTDMLIATTDYAVQSFLVRGLEDKLRDWLKFDIFSIRTTVLQNTLRTGLFSSIEQRDLNVGNFINNSSVYIGKYFGSVLYADMLMHVVYDKERIGDNSTVQGIIFKPEFGFELEAPFANIRWNMAPDISAMINNIIVPSTSVTLSWRFSF